MQKIALSSGNQPLKPYRIASLPGTAHRIFFSMKEEMARLDGARTNPFINPEGYRSYVADGERDFQKVLEAQRRKKAGQ